MTNSLVKILVMVGSSASIGFGIWHFFVPQICWKFTTNEAARKVFKQYYPTSLES